MGRYVANSRCPVCRGSMSCCGVSTITFPTNHCCEIAEYDCVRCHVKTTERVKGDKSAGIWSLEKSELSRHTRDQLNVKRTGSPRSAVRSHLA